MNDNSFMYSTTTTEEHSKALYTKLEIPQKIIVTIVLCYGRMVWYMKKNEILKFHSSLKLNIKTIPTN